ncbi:MAG: beta-propeller fold lactonase family protein [Candidatus Magasanikbacteria bacterium]|nr:beta-propeller fold lactonase family protein [Candidatus Magasanikbacteria bacterium]
MVVDSITASNYLPLAGGTLAGPLFFTSASGTAVTSTNAIFVNATSTNLYVSGISNLGNTTVSNLTATSATTTNLYVSGSLNLSSNSITDAMVVDTITASNYLPISASTSLAYLGFDYPALATSSFLGIGYQALASSTYLTLSASTSLPNLTTVGTITSLTFGSATGTNANISGQLTFNNLTGSNASTTNLYVSGALSLPSNSVTDAMVVDTITASNYLPISASTSLAYLGFDYPAVASSTFLSINYPSTASSTFLTIAASTSLAYLNFNYPATASSTFLAITASTSLSYLGFNYPALATSTFLSISASTSLPNLTQIGTLANLLFTNATGTNINITGQVTLPSNSISDAMVVDTITASNYLLLSGGTLSGPLSFTSISGVDVTSTNAFFDNLVAVSLNISASSTFGTSTIAGGFFQADFTDCSSDAQTVNYNATTGKFTCLTDGGGSGGSTTTWTFSGSNVFLVTSTSKVGIGTSTPAEKLSVVGNISNILDSNNTTSIRQVATTAVGDNPRNIFVSGKYAYTANTNAGTISIIDVSNPSYPKQISTLLTGNNPRGIYVSGRYAYVINYGDNTVSVADVSIPASPALIGTTAVGSGPQSITVSGRYAYITNLDSNSLSVVDISSPLNPIQIATTSVGSEPFAIAVSGRYAYVANQGSNNISVVDISNPSLPIQIATAAVGANPAGISISGRYAYVSNFSSTFMSVVDISNPASPVEVGQANTVGGTPHGIFVSGRYAYVANQGSNTISIFDVSSSTAPGEIGTTPVGASPMSIFVSGRYAYVTNYSDSNISIIDISGTEVSSLMAHSADVGALQVRNDIFAQGSVVVGTGLSVGNGGIISNGGLSVFASSTGVTSSVFRVGSAAVSSSLQVFADGSLIINTTTVRGAFFQTGFTDCSDDAQTVNYNATTGKFTCLTDGGGAATSVFTTAITVTNGAGGTTSSLRADGLFIATSTTNMDGLFFVNSAGSVSASGTLQVFGASALADLTFVSATGTNFVATSLNVSASSTFRTSTIEGGFFQAGFGDCSGELQTVNYDAATGKFTCLADDGGAGGAAGGVNTSTSNYFAVYSGATSVTGTSLMQLTEGTITFTSTTNFADISATSVTSTNLYISSLANFANTTITNATSTNLYVSGVTNLSTLTFASATSTNFAATSLAISASSTFGTSTIAGGFFQADFTDCSADSQTVNYNATTGKFTCLTDGGGSAGSTTTWTFSGSNVFLVTSTSKVGIGTSTPAEKLSVVGSISNILDPSTLISEASNISLGGSTPINIAISGKYAYVPLYSSDAVAIVDISDPVFPVLKSTLITGSQPRDIKVAGRYAYVTHWNAANMVVIDISNPSVPRKVATTTVGANPRSIAISGRFAYIANRTDNNVSIVDISNPLQPIRVTNIDVGGNPFGIAVSGRYAYVINNGENNMHVLDISNPYSPANIATVDVGNQPESVYVSGNRVYTANYAEDSISIIDITDPATPVKMSSTTVGSGPSNVFVSGRYAYVTNEGGTVSIVDVASSTRPIMISNTTIGSSPAAIAVSGRYAYVANSGNATMSIVDISGTEVTSLVAHSADLGQLQVRNDIFIQGSVYAGTSLVVGAGGIMSQGALSVFASSTGSTSSVFRVGSKVSSSSLEVFANGSIVLTSTTISSSTITSLNFSKMFGVSATSTNLYVSASSTFRTSTITGGFFQADFTDCSAESQTVNYNATTGKFTCLTDGGGTASSVFSTAVTVTDGTTTSSLRADGLFIATSTSNLEGLFFVDSTGSVSASGSLQVFGTSTFAADVNLGATANCNGADQALQTGAGGLIVCGNIIATSGGAAGGVNTSTANYFAFYHTTTSVTGTSLMAMVNGSISFTSTTSFNTTTISSSTITHANITTLTVGSCIGCGGGVDSFDIFVSSSAGSGTWTKPAGIDFAQVIVTGGGGGGGAAAGAGADTTSEHAGGGGGGGGTAIKLFDGISLGSTASFTIGAGGAGATSVGLGSIGNTSTFGGFMTSSPGLPGRGQANGNACTVAADGGSGGSGGAATGGDINIPGGEGANGICAAELAQGGRGGASYWGPGSVGAQDVANGAVVGPNGTNWGSGGGGNREEDSSTATPAAAGNGAVGAVVVTSYVASGGDLAEWYETKTDVVPGDIVSVGVDMLEYNSFNLGLEKTSILEKAKPGSSIVGIVSTMPFEVMGGDLLGASTNAKPIALAGRVPVNVSDENGLVKAGDSLAISSIPGVAMRAIKSGRIIGTALQDATCETGQVCKVLVLVSSAYFNGMAMQRILEDKGLDMSVIPEGFDLSRIILTKMIADKESFVASSTTSEIFTDRVMAGLEVITPQVIAQRLIADTIESFSGEGLGLSLADGELFSIFGVTTTSSTISSASSTPVITFDSLGNGFFAGSLTANSITANEIIGLNILTNKLSMLADAVSELNDASSTPSYLSIAGMEVGSLQVSSTATFLSGLMAIGSSTFAGDVSISGNLQLLKLSVVDIESPLISSITSSLGILVEGLSSVSSTIADLSTRVSANELLLSSLTATSTATSSATALDMSVFTQGSGLQFEYAVLFKAGLQTDVIGSVSGTTTMMSDTIFFGRPYLNSDSGGYAVVASGTREVVITFDREYINKPVVQVTMSFEDVTSSIEITTTTIVGTTTITYTTTTIVQDLEFTQAQADAVFSADIRYLVSRVTAKGFTIMLNKPAPFDVRFDWLALAIKNPKLFIQNPSSPNADEPEAPAAIEPQEESVPEPVIIETSTPESEPLAPTITPETEEVVEPPSVELAPESSAPEPSSSTTEIIPSP